MIQRRVHDCLVILGFCLTMGLIGCGDSGSVPASETSSTPPSSTSANTKIQHVVVIFQENVSFDHYFGTYPNALNLPENPPSRRFPTARLSKDSRKASC